MIKITKENQSFKSITKDYEIDIDGKIIEVVKWWRNSRDGDYDCDYEIAESQAYKDLTDDQNDELVDFINNLK